MKEDNKKSNGPEVIINLKKLWENYKQNYTIGLLICREVV